MIGLRHEKYGSLTNKYPFSLYMDLERTPFNLSSEQNWHDNIELQLCTKGEGTVLLDGERYEIHHGDIAVIDSNVVHYTTTDTHLVYTCLIVSTEWCRQMNIPYDTLHFSPIIKSTHIADLIKKLAYVVSDENDSLRVAKSNGILIEIMIELTEKYSSERKAHTSENKRFDAVKNAVTFLRNNYSRKLALSEIAEAVYVDKYTLCKEFKHYTGHTVVEYLHICRCSAAKEFLSEGRTVSETAILCGFDNLSFFTKVFKRYTGEMPSKFKKVKHICFTIR